MQEMIPTTAAMLTHSPDRTGHDLILASASATRALMLRNAGLRFAVETARIDEVAIRNAMLAEQAPPVDIAGELAERKSRKVSARFPEIKVLGADQVVVLDHTLLSKPETTDDAAAQLRAMSGRTHTLYSAAVVCVGGAPIWRHVGKAQVTFHSLTDDEIVGYVTRNWELIRHAAGCYLIEGEGVRLMARIDGDFFTILGLPLVQLLTWLRVRGDITA